MKAPSLLLPSPALFNVTQHRWLWCRCPGASLERAARQHCSSAGRCRTCTAQPAPPGSPSPARREDFQPCREPRALFISCPVQTLLAPQQREPGTSLCCVVVSFVWRPDIFLPSNNFLSHPSTYLFTFLMFNDLQDHKQPVVWKPYDNLRAALEIEF